jgi:hypothetical protein
MRSKLNPIYPRIIPFSPRTSISMVHRKSFVTINFLLHLLSRSAVVEAVPTVIGESRRIGYAHHGRVWAAICGPTPFPASGSFYPSSDSGDREYVEYSSREPIGFSAFQTKTRKYDYVTPAGPFQPVFNVYKYIIIFSGFCLKSRETDWLTEMARVGGVGRHLRSTLAISVSQSVSRLFRQKPENMIM